MKLVKKFYDTDKSRERFFNDLRKTEQYKKAADKIAFIDAAGVAYNLVAVEVDRDFYNTIERAENAERRAVEAEDDLATFGRLIKKYAAC